MSVSIGDYIFTLSSDKVFITFEAGPTHSGLSSAKQLIDAAANAGADAIKFQMVNADRIMGDKDVPFDYQILTDVEHQTFESKTDNLYELLKKREFTKDEWKLLKDYSDQKGLYFFCTAAFNEEIDFLVDEMHVHSIKIASADINHYPLLEYSSKKNVNIQIDTGSGNIEEIERAIDILKMHQPNIIIHHCPTGYPAKLESIHLRMIPTLIENFSEYVIAFSDHSPGWEMDMAAIALGVKLVEKTITLDKLTQSIEHGFSLEPAECKQFVIQVRNMEKALGETIREIPKDVLEGRKKGRRSIYTLVNILKGDKITASQLDFKRPGYGISPSEADNLIGKSAKHNIAENQMIKWEDVE